MSVATGPIALAYPGWGLKDNTITAVTGNSSEDFPHVLCAQMLVGAAASGVKVLVLLEGLRNEDPVWRAVEQLLGGGDERGAAQALMSMPLRCFAGAAGTEHAGRAGLVYAGGRSPAALGKISNATDAPLLVLVNGGDGRDFDEIIHVGNGTVRLDRAELEVSVAYNPAGPVYRQA